MAPPDVIRSPVREIILTRRKASFRSTCAAIWLESLRFPSTAKGPPEGRADRKLRWSRR